MNKTIVSTAVIALVIGFGAGYAIHTSPAPTQGTRGGFVGTNANGGPGGMRDAGGGFLTGTVASKDSGSITLNTRDGSSHVVLVTSATSISKSVIGAPSDVAVGSTIIVSGTTNSDGSVSATLVQLRPAGTPTTQQ